MYNKKFKWKYIRWAYNHKHFNILECSNIFFYTRIINILLFPLKYKGYRRGMFIHTRKIPKHKLYGTTRLSFIKANTY